MKKLKLKFIKWLLKEYPVGFSVCHNTLTNSKLDIPISTSSNIIVNSVDLQDGMEVIIRKIKY